MNVSFTKITKSYAITPTFLTGLVVIALIYSIQYIVTNQTYLMIYSFAVPAEAVGLSLSVQKSAGVDPIEEIDKYNTLIFNQGGTNFISSLEPSTSFNIVPFGNESKKNVPSSKTNNNENTSTSNNDQTNNKPREIADFNGDGFSDLAIGVPEEDTELGIICTESLPILSITSSSNDGNVPSNVLDNNLDTRWSSNGIGQNITGDLGSVKNICSVDIAWYNGNGRDYDFVISTSKDGSDFANAFIGRSSGSSLNSEKYEFPSTDARYVRITVNGNSVDDSASITELDVFGFTSLSQTLYDTGAVNVIYGSSDGLTHSSLSANDSVDNQIWMETGPELESHDKFGSALATGDFNNDGYSDLAIGKPKEDIGTVIDAGGVDVIYGSVSGLSSSHVPIQKWNQGVTGQVDQGNLFGYALETGDFNNDGFSDLVVGIPSDDIGINDNVPDTGSVNVIYGSSIGLSAYELSTGIGRDTQEWNQRSEELTSSVNSAEIGDWFGMALATGDFDADGYSDLAVGISDKDVRSEAGVFNDAGKATVMYGTSDGLHGIKLSSGIGKQHQIWSQDTPGIQDDPETGDRFGHALESGDFNNDGYSDLAIGVWEEKIGILRFSGTVNVIYGTSFGLLSFGAGTEGGADNQVWTQGYLGIVEDNSEEGDRFGSSLATGDFNNDGYSDLVIGVPYEDIGYTTDGAGAINLIYGSSKGLSASGLTAGNGRPDQLWTQNSSQVEGNAETGDMFGDSLAVGDFNKDGISDLALGVPGQDAGITASSAGAINVIYGSKGTIIGSGGLSAVVPFGGFGRSDQLWTQDSPQIKGDSEASDKFGKALS